MNKLFITPNLFFSYLEKDISSNYSNTITNNSKTFLKSGNTFYYEIVQFNISTDGFYGFQIQGANSVTMDGDLYFNYFNDTDLSNNLLTYTYKDKTYTKTLLGNSIQSQRYVLMVTTYYSSSYGSFSLLITGPDHIQFL